MRGFEAEYLDGLGHVAAGRNADQRLLVLFLGSSIGNFNRDEDCEFLSESVSCWSRVTRCYLGLTL